MLTNEAALFLHKAIEMMDSLNEATVAAGGTPFTYKQICEMSMVDLISLLATNDVRFIYLPGGPTPAIAPPAEDIPF
jgi:hypothetical protein